MHLHMLFIYNHVELQHQPVGILGHTTLAKTVTRLCKLAGIEGYKANHSLRATTTSRLYQSGVDEQLVMERTGHRSLEGVRSYKRTSDVQREALSDILNGTKKAKMDSTRTVNLHLAPICYI